MVTEGDPAGPVCYKLSRPSLAGTLCDRVWPGPFIGLLVWYGLVGSSVTLAIRFSVNPSTMAPLGPPSLQLGDAIMNR